MEGNPDERISQPGKVKRAIKDKDTPKLRKRMILTTPNLPRGRDGTPRVFVFVDEDNRAAWNNGSPAFFVGLPIGREEILKKFYK